MVKEKAVNAASASGPRDGFPETRWSLISQARRLSAEDRSRLLNDLVADYWKPLYAYFRARGQSAADAEDTVQEFLGQFVCQDKILQSDPARGRFRYFLMVCAKNFLTGQRRKARTRRQRPAAGRVWRFSELEARDGRAFEPKTALAPDDACRDVWRRTVLEKALRRLEAECVWLGQRRDYEAFVLYYLDPQPEALRWEDVARRLKLADWQQAARAGNRLKPRFAEAIYAVILDYVADPADAEEELRALLS